MAVSTAQKRSSSTKRTASPRTASSRARRSSFKGVNTQLRILLVYLALVAIFGIFTFRLIQLQVLERDEYVSADARGMKVVLPAQRGMIEDIHGEILASDMPMQKVVVDCTRLNKVDALVNLLATQLNTSANELHKKITAQPPKRYLVLQRQIPEQIYLPLQNAIAALKIRGVSFEPDSVRIYPNGSLLSHVIGFTGFADRTQREETGVQGIESTMDRYLRGEPGYRYIERDRTGAELVQLRGVEQAPHNGYNVQLTIDMGLQSIVETELDTAVKKYTPDSAMVIMVRPKTGEILAMASRPNFDLNKRSQAEPAHMRNRAITDIIEPGSTFKIVTVTSALSEKLVRPDTPIYCENGHWEYSHNVLHDAHPLGSLSVHDVLVHSSNIGTAKLALQLGPNRLYQYIKTFGFGERTGIDLPGEIEGIIHPVNRWSSISITHIPMGQEVGVTPLQVVMAMGAIANGGKLMVPQIVHALLDEKNQPVTTFAPVMVRQVASPEAVRQVTAALQDVVSLKGTARGAMVAGFRVAGKTGTAQKVNPRGGGYLPGKYVVSFAGFMPAEDPEFVCLVTLDNAVTRSNENYGGLVSAPIFSAIATKAARYLNLEPHFPDNEKHKADVFEKQVVAPTADE